MKKIIMVSMLSAIILLSGLGLAYESWITQRPNFRTAYMKLGPAGNEGAKAQALADSCLGAILPFEEYTMVANSWRYSGTHYMVTCDVDIGSVGFGHTSRLWQGVTKDKTSNGYRSFSFSTFHTDEGTYGGDTGPMDIYGGQYPVPVKP